MTNRCRSNMGQLPFWLFWLFTLFLTLWSHLHYLVDINYDLTIQNTTLASGTLRFNFAECIRLSWTSGAYLISILVALFSGALPYVKLLTVAYLRRYRHTATTFSTNLHRFTDHINRLAYLDIYFVTLLIVIFSWDNHTPLVGNIYLNIYPTLYPTIYTFIASIFATQMLAQSTLKITEPQYYEVKRCRTLGNVVLNVMLIAMIFVLANVNIFTVTFTAFTIEKSNTYSFYHIFYNLYQNYKTTPLSVFIMLTWLIPILQAFYQIIFHVVSSRYHNTPYDLSPSPPNRLRRRRQWLRIPYYINCKWELLGICLLSIGITSLELPNITSYIANQTCGTSGCLQAHSTFLSGYGWWWVVWVALIVTSIQVTLPLKTRSSPHHGYERIYSVL